MNWIFWLADIITVSLIFHLFMFSYRWSTHGTILRWASLWLPPSSFHACWCSPFSTGSTPFTQTCPWVRFPSGSPWSVTWGVWSSFSPSCTGCSSWSEGPGESSTKSTSSPNTIDNDENPVESKWVSDSQRTNVWIPKDLCIDPKGFN